MFLVKDRLIGLFKKNMTIRQKLFVKSVYETLLLVPNSLVDVLRYAIYSGTNAPTRNREKLRSLLIKNYHVIEKGLSLPNTRLEFGKGLINRTVAMTTMYREVHGVDEVVCHAYNALSAYYDFHLERKVNLQRLKVFLDEYRDIVDNEGITAGGIRYITSKVIQEKSNGCFEDLAEIRCSVRDFSGEIIDRKVILKAIEIIGRTPSVCNRPTTKVYAFADEEKKRNILSLQNGNRGFGHKASHVFIVVSDLNSFNGCNERNQPLIDGGLAAMNLVYALQSQGVGTCFLNWSVNFLRDRKMKEVAGIPDNYTIITLIAAGCFPSNLVVAQSPKVDMKYRFELVDD